MTRPDPRGSKRRFRPVLSGSADSDERSPRDPPVTTPMPRMAGFPPTGRPLRGRSARGPVEPTSRRNVRKYRLGEGFRGGRGDQRDTAPGAGNTGTPAGTRTCSRRKRCWCGYRTTPSARTVQGHGERERPAALFNLKEAQSRLSCRSSRLEPDSSGTAGMISEAPWAILLRTDDQTSAARRSRMSPDVVLTRRSSTGSSASMAPPTG